MMDSGEYKKYALCVGIPLEFFFERYEKQTDVRLAIDSICLLCPVRSICLDDGVQNHEYGVWGGFYLVAGQKDEKKNEHKDDLWNII